MDLESQKDCDDKIYSNMYKKCPNNICRPVDILTFNIKLICRKKVCAKKEKEEKEEEKKK